MRTRSDGQLAGLPTCRGVRIRLDVDPSPSLHVPTTRAG
jgi:hypothetical protein